MAVTRVSPSCYRLKYVQSLVLWQSHCALRVVRITAYLKAIMKVYGKRLQVLALINSLYFNVPRKDGFPCQQFLRHVYIMDLRQRRDSSDAHYRYH